MEADIKGSLNQINKAWKCFEHKGEPMTKKQVIAVLNYGLMKGYEHTGQFTEEEVDKILKQIK
jgi:hypothetical protein